MKIKPWMIVLLYCLGVTAALQAQDKETRTLPSFQRVEFQGRGNLYLIEGTEPAAEILVSDKGELEKVSMRVAGPTLIIEYRKNEETILPVEPKIDIYLTYQQLREVSIAGIINVQTREPVTGSNFLLQVEGMGKNELELNVEHLRVNCAGTANIQLQGNARSQDITLDGTGTIDAFGLITENTAAEVNGTGSILVYARQRLEAEANGFGAEVRYKGNPAQKKISKSGFARIKKE